jgi:hypothetical protein
LSRNTLAGSMVRVGYAVQLIINLLRDHLLEADLILGDETVDRGLAVEAIHGTIPAVICAFRIS